MSGNKSATIVFLNHWASRLGGAEHSLLDILTIAQSQFNCHLITAEPGLLIDKASRLNIQCHIVPCHTSLEFFRRENLLLRILFSWPTRLKFLFYIFQLKKEIEQINPGLIHANIPKSHITLLILSKIGLKKNCCIHLRENFSPGSFAQVLYRLLFPLKTGFIIAISKFVKSNLPSSIQKKTMVIYNGVSIDKKTKTYNTRASLRLLYLGRIVQWKGCHFLIDILALLHSRYPARDISLTMVGDTLYWPEDYRNQLKQKIDGMNLSSSCRMLPYSNNPKDYYLSHDLFCNTSYNEPFGRVIAEAQGFGLPVVAFDSGGIGEIIDHTINGFLIPYGHISLFVEAIGKFIDNRNLIKKMGLKGRKKATLYYNKNIQVPKICEYLARNNP